MMTHQILLVHDNPKVLRVIGRILKEEGYQLTEESSGEAAVRTLSEKDFDLVITDLNMYQRDGLAVLKKAKEQNPETMVILLTDSDHLTSSTQALSFGFDGYLIKPCPLDELLNRVESCLERLKHKRSNARLGGETKNRSSPLPNTRSNPRYAVPKIISYYYRGKRFLTLTMDLGVGGMKIETCHCLPRDRDLNLRLVLGPNSMRLKGRTVYSHRHSGGKIVTGIQFLGVSEENRTSLQGHLASLMEWPKTRGMRSVGVRDDAGLDITKTGDKS